MKGAALMSLARIAARAFSFINLIILARLLDPRDYGIAALALSTIALLQTISDVRVNASIINMRELDSRHLHTGFTLSLLRGLIVGAALLLFADLFAGFSRSPELAGPLRVLAIVPLIDGLKNPSFILFQRNIDFSREFSRTVISTALGSAAIIGAAFYFRGYWAIIIGTLIMRGSLTALTYWRIPADLRLGLHDWRDFVSFGGWLTLAGMLEYIRSGFAPNFLFGRYFGAASLGLFSIAQTLAMLVTRELAMPLITAAGTGLATIVDDPARLRQAYRDAQSTVFGMVLPAGLGVAVLAQPLLLLLAGPQWERAAIYVQVLAPVLAISLVNATSSAVAQAKRRTHLFFRRNCIITALTFPGLIAASIYGDLMWGVIAVAGGVIIETYMSARLGAQLVGSRVREAFVLNWRTFAAGLAMVAALVALPQSSARDTVPLILAVVPRILLGALVYTAALYALWRASGRETGFETKMMDLVGPRLPAPFQPAFRTLRARR